MNRQTFTWLLFHALTALASACALMAEPVVPGTGIKVVQVGDDFEDPNWSYVPRNPKSSEDNNEQVNAPGGASTNGRWYEGVKRGHPDSVRRVPTPSGGLAGSEGALALRSLFTGVPNHPSFQLQQDDFVANVHMRLKGSIPVSQTPNVVTRVYLPPIDSWERRAGTHFAFRAAVDTTITKKSGFLVSTPKQERETYWPGMFIVFQPKRRGQEHDYAYLQIRAAQNGGDFKGLQITQTGWWTMGLSFTPDGQVHYYAKPGIEDLTAADHITSQYPYGYRCERFKTFFYNVCNGDDGRTWSTEWIIDDPAMYYISTR